MLFNINDHVYVKLTDHGKRVHYENYLNFWNNYYKFNRPEYYTPKEDSEGWSKWQMWSLMAEFGSHLGTSKPNVFETTIKLEQ